ncbi:MULTISPECIES: hypothetical protein [Clostridium]|nr:MULTISPECIES: hypothetical protein [Clostridium]MCR1952380.1 hypothetical protein [Clostridium sp. DSM 100503]
MENIIELLKDMVTKINVTDSIIDSTLRLPTEEIPFYCFDNTL